MNSVLVHNACDYRRGETHVALNVSNAADFQICRTSRSIRPKPFRPRTTVHFKPFCALEAPAPQPNLEPHMECES